MDTKEVVDLLKEIVEQNEQILAQLEEHQTMLSDIYERLAELEGSDGFSVTYES